MKLKYENPLAPPPTSPPNLKKTKQKREDKTNHEKTHKLEEINTIRKKKATERGGFQNRTFLIEVTAN